MLLRCAQFLAVSGEFQITTRPNTDHDYWLSRFPIIRFRFQRASTLCETACSDEGFKRMAAEAREAAGAAQAGLQVVQLYRDYLAHFLINQAQGGGSAGAPA